MSTENVIPTSYAEWRHCIEAIGGIRLTADYVEKRITSLEDRKLSSTKEFEKLYGTHHLERTIAWFRKASQELA